LDWTESAARTAARAQITLRVRMMISLNTLLQND